MDRRFFLKGTVAGSGMALAGLPWSEPAEGAADQQHDKESALTPNMIGAYGPWASGLVGDGPARLSFRQPQFKSTGAWRQEARQRVLDCLLQPAVAPLADVRVEQQDVEDGVLIERVSWQLPFGPRTQAVFLKPASAQGRLPAVLGLHDHGGNKFFGFQKITRLPGALHPVMQAHQQESYGGIAWANAMAKRGYAVLVHDVFTFGSRRVELADLHPAARPDTPHIDSDSEDDVSAYNRFASQHEHIMAKSLFCAGTTWPGVFTVEDQRALDYLSSRDDVDPDRLGCAGLSGGGLRTAYLAGLDERLRCACCVGMMTTWRDYLLHKAHTHTWMIYIPGLAGDLDYPEVLALRAPLPTMVLNNRDDPLFTLTEMQRADRMMTEVFEKAGARDAYQCSFYPGPHKFDGTMQREAFDWFDRWL